MRVFPRYYSSVILVTEGHAESENCLSILSEQDRSTPLLVVSTDFRNFSWGILSHPINNEIVWVCILEKGNEKYFL